MDSRKQLTACARKPTSNQVEKKLQSTASLFHTKNAPTGDSEVNTAIAVEKAVVMAWLHELVRAADQLDPESKTRGQQAQIFSYWRAYQDFAVLRCRTMCTMSAANARSFMVSRVST